VSAPAANTDPNTSCRPVRTVCPNLVADLVLIGLNQLWAADIALLAAAGAGVWIRAATEGERSRDGTPVSKFFGM
jgi:hypothetical protein